MHIYIYTYIHIYIYTYIHIYISSEGKKDLQKIYFREINSVGEKNSKVLFSRKFKSQ